MSGQFAAAAIMFSITVGFAALFWLPVIKFELKSSLLRFYWTGFWAYLSGLTALAGIQSVLIILGFDVQRIFTAVLFGVTVSFIVFVMFAWGRLTLKGLTSVIAKSNTLAASQPL
jgi:hypothetical protein